MTAIWGRFAWFMLGWAFAIITTLIGIRGYALWG
jgi:hypothetical protein